MLQALIRQSAFVAACALMMLLGTACAPSAATSARVGSQAPDIDLPLLDGGRARLSEERGNVVLVNFWATWCGPCRSEMPALQHLADEFHGQRFTLWAVNLQEDETGIRPFLDEVGLRLSVPLDEAGEVTRVYNVRGLPATYLIDSQGVVRQQRLGPLAEGTSEQTWTADWLRGQVRSLLAS